MNTERVTQLLARLEIGFRTDSARLKQLGDELSATLKCARTFGSAPGSLDGGNIYWHEQWDEVEAVLERCGGLVGEMDAIFAREDRERFGQALIAWDALRLEDAKLVMALTAIRGQARGFTDEVRKEWNLVVSGLESHLETIHACAQALRVKLELLKEHSKQDVDQLVQRILAKLPVRTDLDVALTASQDLEYRQAARELEAEQHEYLGIMDVVKGLSLWVETTEERVLKNRTLLLAPV